jgi:2-C-methyl-D-erythritol 2,4-cyclodiphosphate synthase
MLKIRSGIGYDIHKLTEGSGLYIGGVRVSDQLAFIAHSDGDVLIHALIDSLLGAIGEDDIGQKFPDTDPKYKDIDSTLLLKETAGLLLERNFEIINIDCVVVAEQPKLNVHKEAIRNSMASLLSIPFDNINVKAKTKEKIETDAVGRGEAIECFCVSMVRKTT